jgi:hypothetical protein
MNSYSNPKVSRKRRSMALLWCPKLSCVPKGSGTEVSGRCRCSRSISGRGTLSGTLRIPSRSSENTTRRVGISEMTSKARRIMVVRSTSPKVPICGSPEGP